MRLINRSQAKARTAELDMLERRASDRLVAIMDVLLALMLVEGALFYRHVFTSRSEANVPVVIAMVLIYYTALRSFIDWHLAMEEMPYRVLTDVRAHVGRVRVRRVELIRFLLDVAIMASYSFLLLRAHVLIDRQPANLLAVVVAYPVIYTLYLTWDKLLRLTYRDEGKRFQRTLPIAAIVLSGVLAIGYVICRSDPWPVSDRGTINALALGVELAIVVLFRETNWYQQVRLSSAPPTVPVELAPSITWHLDRLSELAEKSAEEFRDLKRHLP